MSIKVYPITLGIGGGTSSGKTTLAKQLCAVLPNCTVVHQDHYWTDPEECIIHPIYQQPDLEDPRTAITWPLFRAELKKIKDRTGHSVTLEAAGEPGNSQQDRTETDISTEDFGNLSDETILEWVQRFHDLDEAWKSRGMLLKWYIVEGWHLYYDSVGVDVGCEPS
ncbi:hypothetical protein RSOLAG1IB_11093 [Rhizoctonia solani AG-1 IB]|uniref:Phosphoribulokinase/uridine kinase domain-containing protein n=1 Tax=Thanatephorus cucumeris (strain AG1-IB / isolate 7/3/14) TaxID=1108050 RepID=A0A0B7F767_THACB|nr:hypothetical protein RSOLAG1IB_11093 [Rhizoctonia solani AG-1 IB]